MTLPRHDILPLLDSNLNIYSPPSTNSSAGARSQHTRGRRIVNEIIDNIFDDRTGVYEASSSQCSSARFKGSEHSFDKRLKYWKDMIEERKLLSNYIRKGTGKKTDEILFHRTATIDDRDKQTVKRLMDYAERLNPLNVLSRKQIVLKQYDKSGCWNASEIKETLPRAEQEQQKIVEISGLPQISKNEQLGPPKDQGMEKEFLWLKSKVLERRIEEKREDLERVIEYYPDIENLQIIGSSLTKSNIIKHNPEIEFLGDEQMSCISSETSECEDDNSIDTKGAEEEQCEYGIRINEQTFKHPTKRSATHVEVETRFECEPYEKVIKRVLRLENVGTKLLFCEWWSRAYYQNTDKLLKSTDNEFVFNSRPFHLLAGEVYEVIVLYQPRKVDVVKQKWILKIHPQFFCRKFDAVVVKLSGTCIPPPEYVDKVNYIQTDVIGKSNNSMITKLTTGLASLTPLIDPHAAICPYTRIFDERELFELNNIGYKCERYHDLELLKDLYKRLRRPRERAWDLKVDTIKKMILRVESPDRRALLFNELMGVLEEMRGVPIDVEEKLNENIERDRTRMLYVRGIVSTAIDEWEELTTIVEKAFVEPSIKDFYSRWYSEEERGAEERTSETTLPDEDSVRELMTKVVRRRKAFRDSLLMQTYTHICNFVENIVSVIESTEVI